MEGRRTPKKQGFLAYGLCKTSARKTTFLLHGFTNHVIWLCRSLAWVVLGWLKYILLYCSSESSDMDQIWERHYIINTLCILLLSLVCVILAYQVRDLFPEPRITL